MARGSDELVLLPLGGAGEIGMNLSLYGFGPPERRQWLAVDIGITFPNDLPGIEVGMPDVRFLEEERGNLLGIVLTHGHEDHIGAVFDLWPRLHGVPVHATPFTAALLEAKRAGEPGAPEVDLHVVPVGGRLRVGPFDVEFVPVAHSIPESHALAIRTPLGLVLHTGDWKLDPAPVVGPPTDQARLEALGREGVRAVICDSTNALREGESPSEAEVARSLAELIAAAPRRVAVTIFASNVARIRAVAEAARRADRQVVAIGRSMRRIIDVARETGLLEGVADFLDDQAYGYLPPDKVVALVTGSQGEPRAALARIAAGDHPSVALSRGDRVIFSSRTIPGNERAVGRVINGLVRQGIEVVTDRTHLVHVTGHPRRGELRRLYEWLRPELVVPVHGEELHMAENAAIARETGVRETAILRDGDVLRLAPGPAEVVDEAPTGLLVRDGALLIRGDDNALWERRKLAFAGTVTVSIVLTSRGELAADPQACLTGLPEADGRGRAFLDIVLDAAEGVVDGLPKGKRRDGELVVDAVRRAVRAAVNEAWRKKPLCRVLVSYV